MRKSKLESYEDILGALVKKALTIDNIAYETGMSCSVATQRLDFLLKYGLVEERCSGKKMLYGITERGITVLKTLNFQKYLEKVADTIRTMDDASEVLSTIPGSSKEK
jgi:predicted transcriptional regulator